MREVSDYTLHIFALMIPFLDPVSLPPLLPCRRLLNDLLPLTLASLDSLTDDIGGWKNNSSKTDS